MSAKHRPAEVFRPVDRLTDLFTRVYQEMKKGQRSPEMDKALLDSLQWYHENRLGIVIRTEPKKAAVTPEETQRLLSIPIFDSTIDWRIQRYCKPLGIHYVGELYLIEWKYPRDQKHSQSVARAMVEDFLIGLGFPPAATLEELDWKPPYDNDEFRRLLDQPIETITTQHFSYQRIFLGWKYDKMREVFIGDAFGKSKRDNDYFRSFREHGKKDKGLHAGMWARGWKRPVALEVANG